MELKKLSDFMDFEREVPKFIKGEYFDSDNMWKASARVDPCHIVELDGLHNHYWSQGYTYYLANYGSGWILRRVKK